MTKNLKYYDVIYFYEHAARELDVACAITAILEREYHRSVEIVHWPVGYPSIEYHARAQMVVLPFCYSEASYTSLLRRWRSPIFFNISWEQLFYSGNLKAKTPRGRFATQHVIHHAWSEGYAAHLMDQGIPREHLFINGQPAYALYQEPYRDYFIPRDVLASTHQLNPFRRWILFPENYNWAFYSQAMINQFIGGGQTRKEVDEMRHFCEISLTKTLQWCAQTAMEHNVEIIIRPRPALTVDEFNQVVQKSLIQIPPHLHIIQEETVRDWILASDAVISSYSTSLIEGAVAGKPVFILEPYPFPDSLQVSWHDLLPHLKQLQDFSEICAANTIPHASYSLGEWARSNLMTHADPIRRLAEHFSGLIKGEFTRPKPPSLRAAIPDIRYRYFVWLRKLYRSLKSILKGRNISAIPEEYIKDVQTNAQIRSRVNKWSRILQTDVKV